MNTILVKDDLETFIPQNHKINYVILGTIASSSARTIGEIAPSAAFYYHNRKNHCWKILSHIFYGELREMEKIIDRQNFLENFGIAMANIVGSVEVPESESKNPADRVLFNAHNLKKLQVKKISEEFKNILQTTPMFFTCKSKVELTKLLEDYFFINGLEKNLVNKVNYLLSPTRCTPIKRSRQWEEMRLGR